MAGYTCEGCDGQEQAVLLITPLTGGETLAIGSDCMPVMLAQLLAGAVAVDAGKLWAATDRLVKSTRAAEVKELKEAAVPPGGPPDGAPDGWAPGVDGPTGDSSADLAAAAAAPAGPAAGQGGGES